MASLQVASAGWLPARWLPQTGFRGFRKESSAPRSWFRKPLIMSRFSRGHPSGGFRLASPV